MKRPELIKTVFWGLMVAALLLLGSLPATAQTCQSWYITAEGTLVIDLGGAFYDSVTFEPTCEVLDKPGEPDKNQRPLSEFLDVQGTYCYADGAGGCQIFVPGIPNMLTFFDASTNRGAVVDYAGLIPGFGTIVTGSVSERPEGGGTGRARILVDLFVERALTWVTLGLVTQEGTVLFGNPMVAINAGAAPSFTDSHMRIDIIRPALGLPMIDLVQIFAEGVANQGLRSLAFEASGTGELRAAFGVADGTKGKAELTIVQLTMSSGSATLPVDNIKLEVVKQRGAK